MSRKSTFPVEAFVNVFPCTCGCGYVTFGVGYPTFEGAEKVALEELAQREDDPPHKPMFMGTVCVSLPGIMEAHRRTAMLTQPSGPI